MFLMREMQSIARENLGDRLEKDKFKILLEMSSLNVCVLISASHTVQRVHWLHIKRVEGSIPIKDISRSTPGFRCLVSLVVF